MPRPVIYSMTLRALAADTSRTSAWASLAAVALLGGWAAWLAGSEVAIVAVSERGRIETRSAVVPVVSEVSGRLVTARLEPGREVRAGELLAEIDGSEGPRLAAAAAGRRALGRQDEALRLQLAAARRAGIAAGQRAAASQQEAAAAARSAVAAESLASEQLRRQQRLADNGLVAPSEAARARHEADERHWSARALAEAAARLRAEARIDAAEREGRLAELLRQLAQIRGEEQTATLEMRRLSQELVRARLRAPIAGRLGAHQLPGAARGGFVARGARLAEVVPLGAVKIVAEFSPATAYGWLRPGLAARVRLQGRPVVLAARVSRTGGETAGGRVLVELLPAAGALAPLRPGQPVRVEIELERVRPAVLLWRLVAPPRPLTGGQLGDVRTGDGRPRAGAAGSGRPAGQALGSTRTAGVRRDPGPQGERR